MDFLTTSVVLITSTSGPAPTTRPLVCATARSEEVGAGSASSGHAVGRKRIFASPDTPLKPTSYSYIRDDGGELGIRRVGHTSVKTSGSSGPSSAEALPPAGLDAPKLKAILSFSELNVAEGERVLSLRGELCLKALGEGELGGVESERRRSDLGLRERV